MLPTMTRLVACSTICVAWLVAGASAQEADVGAALRLPPPTYLDAVAHLRAGRPAEGMAALERDAANAGSGIAPPLEHTILRAALLAELGRPAAAESAWEDVIARAVFMRTFARRGIVESAAGRGAPARAEPYLTELVRGDPARHRDLLLRVAESYLAAGRPGRAAALYRQVSRRHDVRRSGRCRTPGARGRSRSRRRRLRRPGNAADGPAPTSNGRHLRVGTTRSPAAGRRSRRDTVTLHRNGVPRPRSKTAQRFPLRVRPGAARRMGGNVLRASDARAHRRGTHRDALRTT